MKLRMLGNSLRLRLTRMEIARLAATGSVGEQTRLSQQPGQIFAYRLELCDGATKPTICFQNSLLSVRLPVEAAKSLETSEVVGIYAEEPWGLKIAVEKDFKCLTPRLGEDESDAFENPAKAGHPTCDSSAD